MTETLRITELYWYMHFKVFFLSSTVLWWWVNNSFVTAVTIRLLQHAILGVPRAMQTDLQNATVRLSVHLTPTTTTSPRPAKVKTSTYLFPLFALNIKKSW